MELKGFDWVRRAVYHPIEGFEDMRWKKAGSLKIAFFIVFLLFVGLVFHGRLFGFQFGAVNDKTFSVAPYIMKSVILFAAWTVGNWSVCTLLDGEGTMRNICVYSAYALVPYVVSLFVTTGLSHILIRDEVVFINVAEIIGVCWSGLLLFSAVRVVHQYSPGKTVFAIVVTIAAMLVMLFLLILFMSLVQQIWIFVSSIYTELTYRLRT